MSKIDTLLKEWRSLQPLKPEFQHRIDQQFMFDFNYSSNHLEGNTLTYGQTKLLLLFGRVEGEALFHYRYIRIHPFEDGNGRIARLLMNYISLRNNYPMIVIPTTDRNNYLAVLGKCDKTTGKIPADGANATIEQVAPFVEYITPFLESKLNLLIPFAKGEIKDFSEVSAINDDTEKMFDNKGFNKSSKGDDTDNDTDNVPKTMADKRQLFILKVIKMNDKVSATELAKLLKTSLPTIKRDFKQLQERGIIAREGSERGGRWRINELE